MKLTEFNLNTISIAKKALKENFNMPFNMDTLTPSATNAMLKKVRGLISETRESSQFYESQNSPAYMKLVMMQQALTKRVSEYTARPTNRIVVENEEVENNDEEGNEEEENNKDIREEGNDVEVGNKGVEDTAEANQKEDYLNARAIEKKKFDDAKKRQKVLYLKLL